MLSFNGEELLALTQPPNWRTAPVKLPATAYPTCLQLPSISADHFLHLQYKEKSCHFDRDLFIVVKTIHMKVEKCSHVVENIKKSCH
jgi:hypothetical protein